MPAIHLVAVGRLRPALREVADDYLTRLGRYADVREREVREAGRAGAATVQRREEGRRIAEALPKDALVVALALAGEAVTSEGLARRVEAWREQPRPVALLVGGAAGLDPALEDGAAWRWSLGRLTLPHELARVVVLEQLYRACTILAGGAYHK